MKRKNEVQKKIEQVEKKLTNRVTRKKNKKKIIISTAFAITGAAVIVTPIIIYKKENAAYEVLIESPNSNFQSYAMTLTKGATITNLKSKLVKMEGHILSGVYKDEACTIKYEDTEKVTKNSVVYLKYEKITYSVSLPTSKNFKILYSTSVDISKIEWGDTFTFQVLLEEPYNESDIEVFVDDEKLLPDKHGFYQISFVDKDVLVKINGVEINTYSIANLPSQVTVVNSKGKELNKKDKIEYGETVTVSFNETVGYDVSKFTVNGKEILSGEKVIVTENLNIVYQETKTQFKISLPEVMGVSFEYSNLDLNDFYTNDTFKFKINLDEAYANSDPVLYANGEIVHPNGQGEYVLTFIDENIDVDIEGIAITAFEISSLPSQIIIKDSENNRYVEGDAIIYGTSVTITYEESQGCAMTSFEVNGEEVDNHAVDLLVKNGFSVSYEEMDVSYLSFLEEEDYISVVGYDGSVAEVVIPKTYHKKPVQVIAEHVFSDNAAITSIVLPNTIKQIERFAFQGCDGITSLYLPASVELIGDYAFANTSIEEITIEEGSELKTLESDAFSAFSQSAGHKLKSINLEVATKLTKIGSGTFGYTEIEEIIIPESVTELGNYAFYSSSLKSIKIPASVELMGDDCFAACENLTQLEFAENSSLEYIGIEAFKNSGISGEIVLPKNVKSLGLDAFAGTQITKFSLEEGSVLSSIDEAAFGSIKLQTLDLKNTNSLTTINKCIVRYNNETLEELYLPASLISLGQEAFKDCAKLTKVEFAENSLLETIGDSAFGSCTSLREITIPASVKTIETHAFYYCDALNNVNIDNGSNLESIGEEAFDGDPIEYVNLEDATKLKMISRSAFARTNLTSVTIPASVTTIDNSAFEWCSLLTIVNILENSELEIIGESAFYACPIEILNIIYATKLKTIGNRAFYGTNITSLDIPASVEVIDEYAFADCFNLITLNVPTGSNLKTIEASAFGFNGLNSIDLSNALNLQMIGDNAFYETSAATVKFPSGLEYIGNSAFANSIHISTITLPSTLQSMGNYAFEGTINLKSLQFEPNSQLRYFSPGCFKNSFIEGEIIIPKSVQEIMSDAFLNTRITKFSFEEGSKITTLNGGSLQSITLEEIDFSNATMLTSLSSSIWAFGGYDSPLAKIVIPAGVTELEDFMFDGGELSSIVFAEGSQLTKIGHAVFSNCNKLKSITIPASVTTIDSYAFSMCSSLETVNIEEGSNLQTIGESAFESSTIKSLNLENATKLTTISKCALLNTELTSITIPASVTTIGEGAFKYSYNLKNVNIVGYDQFIPESGSCLKDIGKEAFYECTSLETITLNIELEKIGQFAFYNCSSLSNISLPNYMLNYIGNGAFAKTAVTTATLTLSDTSDSYLGQGVFSECQELQTIYIDSVFSFNNLSPEDIYTVLTHVGGGFIYVKKDVINNGQNDYLYQTAGKVEIPGDYDYFALSY